MSFTFWFYRRYTMIGIIQVPITISLSVYESTKKKILIILERKIL